MCTGINYFNGHHMFGRNLDLEIDYPVSVVITPRNHGFKFKGGEVVEKGHYAIIGVGIEQDDYPLYFDAANEKGLGMAGLAFFGMASYSDPVPGKNNLAEFELIPYFLSKCATVEEVKEELKDIIIDNVSFSPQYPASEMHWIVGDKDQTIVIECTKEHGMQVYDDPFNCLTNCPGFPYQKENVSYYANVTGEVAPIRFANDKDGLWAFSRGLGTIGLPGGTDSVSRFVRCAFTLRNSICPKDDVMKNVAEFFHILGNEQQVNGESEVKKGQYEITQYTSCVDTETGILYYSTYYNPMITGVDMNKENLDSENLILYPVIQDLKANMLN